MPKIIRNDIRSIGKFKLLFLHCIDISGLVDDKSKERILAMRANDDVYDRLLGIVSDMDASTGTFSLLRDTENSVESKTKLSMNLYAKSVFTPMFLDTAIPLVLNERVGQKILKKNNVMNLGYEVDINELISSKMEGHVLYHKCELRIFREGILSTRFEFSGDEIQIEDFISLITVLRQLTREAFLEKIGLIVRDWTTSGPSVSKLGINFISYQEILNHSILVRRLCADHTVIVVDALKNAHGNPIPVFKIEESAGLLGIIRQTQSAISYKQQMLASLKEYNLGYKSDEIYITFRSTTMVLLPKHWNPDTFQALYIDDLVLLIEYYVSKITFLESLSLIMKNAELNKPLEVTGMSRDLIDKIILLRKILVSTDESLDVDLLVNHYFTRGVLLQLIEQRGVRNKLDSIKKRISNIDNMLQLVTQYTYLHMGLSISSKQVQLGIWALLATLVFSLASLILALLQFGK